MGRSEIDPDSRSVLLSLLIGFGSFIVIWVLFELLRRWIPRLYYYRWFLSQYEDVVDYNGKRVFCHRLPGRAWLGWVAPTAAVDLESMASTHGLDAVMFLRFMRSSSYMFGVLMLGTAALLIPIYATGQNKNLPPGHPQNVVGINILSIANLRASDPRLWGTLIAEFICAFIIYFFTYSDYKKFVYLRRRYKASSIPANFSAVVTEIPGKSLNEDSIRRFFDKILPNSVAEVHHVLNAVRTQKNIRTYMKEVSKREHAEWRMAKDPTGQRPSLLLRTPGTTKKIEVDSISYHTANTVRLERQVLHEQEERDPTVMPVTSSAVVLFEDNVSAAFLTQTKLWKTTSKWKVHAGWDPGAINWSKLVVSQKARKPITVIGNMVIIMITISWGLVIVAIQGLENLRALAGVPGFEFIQKIVDNWPASLVSLVEGVLPSLLLMLLLKLIPLIFRQIINRQKIYALPLIETKIRNFFYVFLIFSNFVYVVISGTVLQQLDVILRNPSLIVQQLAIGIAQQGVFMMKYVLLNSLVGYPLYVLDPGRLIIRSFIYWFGAKTIRQQRAADRIFSQFFYFKFYALSMMISLLGSVYTTIAPLINVFTAFYFFIGYFCCKYKLLYMNYYPMSTSGYWSTAGMMHEGCFHGMLIAMLIHQVSMVVLFGIYRAVPQAVIEVVLVACTVSFIRICKDKFSTLSKTGALAEVMVAEEPQPVPDHFYGLYVHPGLIPPSPGPKLAMADEKYDTTLKERSLWGRTEAVVLQQGGVHKGIDSEKDT